MALESWNVLLLRVPFLIPPFSELLWQALAIYLAPVNELSDIFTTLPVL